jgi:hypothetical protein
MAVGVREDEQLDDATRAFEDLRAEVVVLRRAVEALGPALKENRAPDYSLTLGQIARAQATVYEHLAAMEGHPALQLMPEAFGARRAGGERPRARLCVTPRVPPRQFRGRTKRRRRCSALRGPVKRRTSACCSRLRLVSRQA